MIHNSDLRNSISAIIPAYNEANNILKVIKPLKQVSDIKEIIVVNDGSENGTGSLVQQTGGIKIISLPHNAGTTKAVLRGISESAYPIIALFDADLINLKPNHIAEMIEKYHQGYDMVIMDKGSQPWVFQVFFKSVPAVSGTRILKKDFFAEIPFMDKDRFQLEIRINDYFLKNNLSIAVSSADEVHDLRKYTKYPFLKGLLLDVRGGYQVLASDGPASVWKNLQNFRRIKKLAISGKTPADNIRRSNIWDTSN